MKITFKPLNEPAPVRPADMPEGVAFEYEHHDSIHVGQRYNDGIHQINKDGLLQGVRYCSVHEPRLGAVLKRRDGLPLPRPEPVPLDTLQPFPVWYRDRDGDYQSRLPNGRVILYYSSTRQNPVQIAPAPSSGYTAYQTPYIMEVTP